MLVSEDILWDGVHTSVDENRARIVSFLTTCFSSYRGNNLIGPKLSKYFFDDLVESFRHGISRSINSFMSSWKCLNQGPALLTKKPGTARLPKPFVPNMTQ